jgi:glycosyltransferase involved in cell wall biosynthesis
LKCSEQETSAMFNFDTIETNRRRRIEQLIDLCHRRVAEYTIISREPLIFFVPIDLNLSHFVRNYKFLFDSLKDRKAFVICNTWWHFENEKNIDELNDLLNQFKLDYPNFKFVLLCNTRRQLEKFEKRELRSVFCSSNCFVDENLFFPMPEVKKEIDAVYDGRLVGWKRHYLAAELKNLGLIYYAIPWLEENAFMKKLVSDFSRAKFFNHSETGAYRKLSPPEINRALNLCRVGLSLSAEEGANYASIQYLLAGLPVVTTANTGGRDEFLDEENSITVDADPDAVKRGVEKMIKRAPAADSIRNKTLERIKTHRDRFILLVQSIYDEEGVDRDFSIEWEKLFYHRLLKNRNHLETIELLSEK